MEGFFKFMFSVYGHLPSMYVYAYRGQKRVLLDLLEPELQSVVSHHICAGGLV